MSRSRCSRRAFLRLGLASALEAGFIAMGGLAYAYKIEPGWVKVESVPLVLPRLAPEFDGFRLVQISDIHMDDRLTGRRLVEVLELVNRQRPDLVAITGDFFTSEPKRFAEDMIAALNHVQAAAAAAE